MTMTSNTHKERMAPCTECGRRYPIDMLTARDLCPRCASQKVGAG